MQSCHAGAPIRSSEIADHAADAERCGQPHTTLVRAARGGLCHPRSRGLDGHCGRLRAHRAKSDTWNEFSRGLDARKPGTEAGFRCNSALVSTEEAQSVGGSA
jgi:hypothetical protein